MIPDYRKNTFAITQNLLTTKVGRLLRARYRATVLHRCKDIWCRDFMPVQAEEGRFVQFIYAPHYLVRTPSDWKTITPPGACYPPTVAGSVQVVPLVLDGGAVVGNQRLALVSERVVSDNPRWTRACIKRLLKSVLSVREVVLVREAPDDFTGHLDGSIRLVSESEAVVGMPPGGEGRSGRCAEELARARAYSLYLVKVAKACQLRVIEVIDVSYRAPVRPPYNTKGLYANFLQLGRKLLVPAYGLEREDALAKQQLQDAGFDVELIDAREFVQPGNAGQSGGAINCVTWSWASS